MIRRSCSCCPLHTPWLLPPGCPAGHPIHRWGIGGSVAIPLKGLDLTCSCPSVWGLSVPHRSMSWQGRFVSMGMSSRRRAVSTRWSGRQAGDGVSTVWICPGEAHVGESSWGGWEGRENEGEGDAADRFYVHGDHLPGLPPKVPALMLSRSEQQGPSTELGSRIQLVDEFAGWVLDSCNFNKRKKKRQTTQ